MRAWHQPARAALIGRAGVTVRHRKARPQLFTVRVRAHRRLARLPLSVPVATIRPPVRACLKVMVPE